MIFEEKMKFKIPEENKLLETHFYNKYEKIRTIIKTDKNTLSTRIREYIDKTTWKAILIEEKRNYQQGTIEFMRLNKKREQMFEQFG